MKKYFLYSIFLIGISAFYSCSKFLEVGPPKDELEKKSAFLDDRTATATVLGMYTQMNGYSLQFANGLLSFMTAMTADEFYYAFTSFDDFKTNNLNPSTSFLDRFWSQPYSYINHANEVIEGLEAATELTESVKSQLLGEAHFVRAFCYFYLVNLFGDVPLVIDTDFKKNTLLPRTSTDSVKQFIWDELLLARDFMTDEYSGTERVRPNKKAAEAMIARVALYQQKWSEAEASATEVINDTRYRLLDDLDNVFLKNSEEAIWQLQTVNTSTAGVNTWEGFTVVPFQAGGRSYYNLTDDLYGAFESGDNRKDAWLNSYVLNEETFYYPYKYKIRTQAPVEEYSMVLRFAEQYLIRAEARAQQDDLVNAIADLNVIRERADVPLLPTTLTKQEVLDAVAHERRLELFVEWGHRWFDLKRTGKAVEVLSDTKDGFTTSDLLFPIPLNATRTNPNLTQNDY